MDVYWHLALIIVLVGFALAIVDFFLHDDPKPPREPQEEWEAVETDYGTGYILPGTEIKEPLTIDWDAVLVEMQKREEYRLRGLPHRRKDGTYCQCRECREAQSMGLGKEHFANPEWQAGI